MKIDKLNEYKIEDEIMDKIEGGVGSSNEAKQLQLTAVGNIFHFGKNVSGNNSIFQGGSKSK